MFRSLDQKNNYTSEVLSRVLIHFIYAFYNIFIQLPATVVGAQAWVLHEVLWVLLPEHESPPPNGVGLVQVRDRYFKPPPQVTVQEV